MKASVIALFVVVAGVGGLVAWNAFAQDMGGNAAGNMAAANMAANCPCPMCGNNKMTMEQKREFLKKAGLTDQQVDQVQAVMMAQFSPADPDLLLAMDRLNLTADQKSKLQEISQKAQNDAAAVLNADQKKMVGDTSKTFTMKDTMMQVHQKMKSGMMRGREMGNMSSNAADNFSSNMANMANMPTNMPPPPANMPSNVPSNMPSNMPTR